MSLENNCIDGKLFERLLTFGALNLQANAKEINDLNVFPVPDGDTGDNMYATLAGGVDSLKKQAEYSIDCKANALAEGMLLNARGNSGVILSQLFYGIAQGLLGLKVATVPEFCGALKKGVECAYKAVVKPVEGTILTVAREAADRVFEKVSAETTLEGFFLEYLKELKVSLQKTPELLEVLKESGVVDSGGAGLVCIAEGFYKAIVGDETLAEVAFTATATKTDINTFDFDENSKMDFGYCTEVLVQLLSSKGDVQEFNLDNLVEFLTSIGDSVAAVQTGTKVKIHVHTMTPALVLEKCQKYGEFISVKIENMTLQHNTTLLVEKPKKREKTAIVAVASGEGLAQIYLDNGADYIVSGGQTDNPSTEDFIKGFDHVNADTVFVLPNNKNIVLAAKQAAELYKNSKVIVLPSKTPQQVYSALALCIKGDEDMMQADMTEGIESVDSYAITYAVRDAVVNGIEIKEGDYMAFSPDGLMLSEKELLLAFKRMIDSADEVEDKEIVTIFYGKNVNEAFKQSVRDFIEERLPDAELIEHEGGQEVYSLLVALE
ncbi:MAG: DAK2 domain-containing protein [Clostridiales bacterium]|nr:DAK2 domain-containing protein [Clostridiales bacterium]